MTVGKGNTSPAPSKDTIGPLLWDIQVLFYYDIVIFDKSSLKHIKNTIIITLLLHFAHATPTSRNYYGQG